MKPIRLILADDHPVYRQGLRSILEAEEDLEVIAEAGDGAEALELARDLSPDLLLLDVTMPTLDGLSVAKACQSEGLPCRLIFITMHQEEQLLGAALKLGVRGYVLKESVAGDVAEAVRTVAEGGEYLSAPLVQLLMRRERSRMDLQREVPGIDSLTVAERKVLRLVASDRTSKQIASDLGVSVRTVDSHRARITKKLRLSGSHSLVKFAFENREKL